jgi:hypothetical protein
MPSFLIGGNPPRGLPAIAIGCLPRLSTSEIDLPWSSGTRERALQPFVQRENVPAASARC